MSVFLQPIYTQTVGSGGASSITFNNIPQTFTDLMLKCSFRGDTTNSDFGITGFQTQYLRINNDTSGNLHTSRYVYGNGASVASSASAAETIWRLPSSTNASDTANTFANSEIYIPNYTSSNFKSAIGDIVSENNGTTAVQMLGAYLYRSTNAITRIDIFTSSGNFVQYSSVSLYGITKG